MAIMNYSTSFNVAPAERKVTGSSHLLSVADPGVSWGGSVPWNPFVSSSLVEVYVL